MAVIIYTVMLDSISAGAREVMLKGVWIANTVPNFTASTQG